MAKNATCPIPPTPNNVVGDTHNTLLYLCAASLIITFLLSSSLIYTHLTSYSAPREQRQIIRTVFTPVVTCVISVCSVYYYNLYDYLVPVGHLYEAIGLTSLFLLFVQYQVPRGTFSAELFESLALHAGREGDVGYARMKWLCAFQFLVVSFVTLIIAEATQATGTYCAGSLKPRFANFWVTLLRSISMTLAILSILRMYKSTPHLLKPHHSISKLGTFKLLLGLDILQTWIINALCTHDVLRPNTHMSYADLRYGVPCCLVAVESVVFAGAFWWAYGAGTYKGNREMGLLRAGLDVCDPRDLVLGVWRCGRLVVGKAGVEEVGMKPLKGEEMEEEGVVGSRRYELVGAGADTEYHGRMV